MNRYGKDGGTVIELAVPLEFSFTECLIFLERSDQELLHQTRQGYLYKLIKIGQELVLLKIGSTGTSLQIEFPIKTPSKDAQATAIKYVKEWFDLDKNLRAFYETASKDKMLKKVAEEYAGLRVVGIPDLFEAITWAIMGQQINLKFAYTLKQRFVQEYGEHVDYDGQSFWLFPEYETIADLSVEHLRKLQFTTRKAEYIIGIAHSMRSGSLSKNKLIQMESIEKIHRGLTSLRGIGDWTADYVLMKCFRHQDAFPIADVGLHLAMQKQLGLDRKPAIEEIKDRSKDWIGWRGYATFYLWRSLYDESNKSRL
ncbi:DNA-3-methyladenine glycosylase family protein [Cytobacillus purgationiresistens]|uniref:DNA-3-methyladenine glycosylase II n=1 Tax=Cytobacillus purgationiresistens TaxID=863449 RepID=A0ABU0AKS6_9BACI|nr:DNA-3-methyladenine glycosylase [Cytobacillus purgationiresistens]MDQ0271859.1 DNA-3-methyladenine glycosylase II [Cytobacillus purgationiresistens]